MNQGKQASLFRAHQKTSFKRNSPTPKALLPQGPGYFAVARELNLLVTSIAGTGDFCVRRYSAAHTGRVSAQESDQYQNKRNNQ